jgi:phosphate-selective porin
MENAIGGEIEKESNNGTDYSGANLEGKSWIRNNNNVDLSNAKQNTIAGLNHISDIFQKATGKPLIVTSGNDGDMHASGEFSHGNGWKVDVSGNGLEDPKIRYPFIKQSENLGITVRDEYDNPSPNSTGGHLDLTFNGYKGSRPTQSRWGALRMTPKAMR